MDPEGRTDIDFYDVYGLTRPDEPKAGGPIFHTSCKKCRSELTAESYDLLLKEQEDHGCQLD